jgi:hypothetical protein
MNVDFEERDQNNNLFTVSQCQYGWRFTNTATDLHIKLAVCPLLQILVTVHSGHALLQIFTQNLLFVHCSRFLWQCTADTHFYRSSHKTCCLSAAPDSCHSSQRKRTASSAACELTAHWVCSSCKRKLEHVQACLGTWVCVTIHPSYTLRSFRELNSKTMSSKWNGCIGSILRKAGGRRKN